MKKIKFIILILCIFILSGCTVDYNMEIYNDTIKENITIGETNIEVLNNSEQRNILEESVEVTYDYWKETNNTNYKLSKILEDNKIGLKINGKHELGVIRSLTTVNNCYQYFNIVETEDTYVLSTSKENLCFDANDNLDDMNIKISTNHKVIKHNSDKKNKDTYIWTINRDNYKDKLIQMEFYKDKYVRNYNNRILKRLILIILVIGGTVLVAFTGYKLYRKREDNVNF